MSMQIPIEGGLRTLVARLRRAVRARRLLMEGLLRLQAEPVPEEALARTLDALQLPTAETASRWKWGLRITHRRSLMLAMPLICLLAGGYSFRVWSDRQPNIVLSEHEVVNPNAAIIWAEAAQMVDEKGSPRFDHKSAEGEKLHLQLAERRAILKANSAALARMREGLKYRCLQPLVRSFGEPMPQWSAMRGLARIVQLEADTLALEGKPAEAMRCALDGMELGIRVQHGSVLIGMLVGLSCTAIARSQAWALVDKLDAATARAAAVRLEKLDAERYSLAECFKEEARLGQVGLLEVMKKPDWRRELMRLQTTGESSDLAERAFQTAHTLLLYAYSKDRIMNRYTRHMNKILENIRHNYPHTGPLEVDDPLLRMLIPSFSAASFQHFASAAQDRLLMVACALRAYSREHGRYPDTLQQLVPAYLKALPSDPFSPIDYPLRYRRVAKNRYILFSIGPDQSDDRGSPIGQADGTAGSGSEVNPYSIGDIVAGANRN